MKGNDTVPESRIIFISYSHIDGEKVALRLYNGLEAEGYSPWIDCKDIPAGKNWDTEIDIAIRNCWVFVFLMTDESIKSDHCADEWSRALELDDLTFIPLKYTSAREKELPHRLGRKQSIDFTGEYEDGFADLKSNLYALSNIAKDPPDLSASASLQDLQQGKLPEAVVYDFIQYCLNNLAIIEIIKYLNSLGMEDEALILAIAGSPRAQLRSIENLERIANDRNNENLLMELKEIRELCEFVLGIQKDTKTIWSDAYRFAELVTDYVLRVTKRGGQVKRYALYQNMLSDLMTDQLQEALRINNLKQRS